MGKTGLIKNVFYYIQKENKSAACFYLDIFSTQNLQEFVSLLGRSCWENQIPYHRVP